MQATSGTAAPIAFAGSSLRSSRHVCAFFNSPDEEYRTMLPFMRDGLAQGERVFHMVDGTLRDDLITRLSNAGVDVADVQRRGQLALRDPRETYLRHGRFDADAMLELIQEVLDTSPGMGFPLTRVSARVDWATAEWSSADDWIEYEIRLNYLLPRYQDPVICTYDCNRLSAGVALEVLRTHPVAVLGGVLQENPFYVPPDELLLELEERRRRTGSGPARYNGHHQ